MRLSAVVAELRAAGLLVRAGDGDVDLLGVVDDSRRVCRGALFCAVVGTAADGHDYAAQAVRQGAVALLVSRPLADLAVPQVLVRDGRRAAAAAAAVLLEHPADRLTLVGVTGTNGKSTTVSILRHLLNAEGTAASLGTLGAVAPGGTVLPDTGNLTTPGPVDLQTTLAALAARGARTVAIETSSHALHQGRTAGLPFAAGVYTNLTHDHLDYHGDYDSYLAAKALLSAQIIDGGAEIVNADDPAWAGLPPRPALRRLSFGLDPGADVRASAITLGAAGAQFTLVLDGAAHPVTLPLLGAFNVSNALGATAAARVLGVPAPALAARLATAPQVSGRMECLVARGWVVLRDYAHTPDALRRALGAVRRLTMGRLIVLFGAGGDRDRVKRPVMGGIAARHADLAVVTSDNPRTEDPERILDDIEAGMDGIAHLRISDRRAAIARALSLLAPGDVLLLAGKGHETYQVVGTERQPFDERAIVQELVGAR